jgi:hypothetical protein
MTPARKSSAQGSKHRARRLTQVQNNALCAPNCRALRFPEKRNTIAPIHKSTDRGSGMRGLVNRILVGVL